MLIAAHEALEQTEEDTTPKCPRIESNSSATTQLVIDTYLKQPTQAKKSDPLSKIRTTYLT